MENTSNGNPSTTAVSRARVDADESLSEAVVRTVADVADRRPVRSPDHDGDGMAPLFESIDPEALDRLFRPTGSRTDPASGRVTFSYEGLIVVAHSDGRIRVREAGHTA